MTLKNKILNLVTLPAKRHFEKACREAPDFFYKKWQETAKLLMQDGTYWSKKGFNKTSSLEDFPITTYDEYLEAMEKGARTGLSPFNFENVDFCMVSSGTTGPLKPFLMTKSYKKQYQIIAAPFIHYMTKLMDYGEGKLIYLISLDSVENNEYKVGSGTIGNYTYKNIPFYLKQLYALPQKVLTSKEVFKKEAPLHAIANDIAAIYCVTPPVGLNFLSNLLDENIKKRIKFVLDNEEEYKLKSKRKALLKRLLLLEQIESKDLWPKLQMTSTWTSSVCSLSIPKFQAVTGNVPTADGLYSATEGWVCVQTDFIRKGSIYHPDGCILEFIPIDKEIIKENLIKPWQLEVGNQYEVFFTNKMGLIRYRIGDILECTGFFEKSPVIQFVQKSSSSISLGIIRLTESELIEVTRDILPSNTRFFYSSSPSGNSLSINIFQKDIERIQEYNTIAKRIDDKLINANIEYASKRKDGVLKECILSTTVNESLFPQDQTGQVKPKIIRANYI
jgi:hypothetical protein